VGRGWTDQRPRPLLFAGKARQAATDSLNGPGEGRLLLWLLLGRSKADCGAEHYAAECRCARADAEFCHSISDLRFLCSRQFVWEWGSNGQSCQHFLHPGASQIIQPPHISSGVQMECSEIG
jgi:hypothetical protein